MTTSPKVPESIRVFLAGDSGSGKSTRAWEHYLAHQPRVIMFDMMGEWVDYADAVAYSIPETVDAIRHLAGERGTFKIAVLVDPSEMATLVDWMIPLHKVRESPVIKMGGAMLLVDEVDLVAGNRGEPPEHIRTLYRRSRHAGLSVVSTTQRPANVNKEVTAQCAHIWALRLSEPRDRDYIGDFMRFDRPMMTRYHQWTMKHLHGAVFRNVRTGEILWYPDSGLPSKFPNDGDDDEPQLALA